MLIVGLGERGGAGAGHEVGAGQEGAEAGAGRGGTGEIRAGWLDRSEWVWGWVKDGWGEHGGSKKVGLGRERAGTGPKKMRRAKSKNEEGQ